MTTETAEKERSAAATPTPLQRAWLARGFDQPGGKLPLFDRDGQRISPRTIKACIEHGWAEPWFANPLKPDWLVCKLTTAGRRLVMGHRLQVGAVDAVEEPDGPVTVPASP